MHPAGHGGPAPDGRRRRSTSGGEMGDLIEAVAAYDGSPAAIGYTVYYYAEDMEMADGLKLLSVDGVAPSDETIRSGAVPVPEQLLRPHRRGAGGGRSGQGPLRLDPQRGGPKAGGPRGLRLRAGRGGDVMRRLIPALALLGLLSGCGGAPEGSLPSTRTGPGWSPMRPRRRSIRSSPPTAARPSSHGTTMDPCCPMWEPTPKRIATWAPCPCWAWSPPAGPL